MRWLAHCLAQLRGCIILGQAGGMAVERTYLRARIGMLLARRVGLSRLVFKPETNTLVTHNSLEERNMFAKLLLGTAVVAVAVAVAPAPARADGKQAFLDAKCQKCHSVQAAGIEKGVGGKMSKGPDLSGVGLDHDAAWVTKWLNKEVDAKSVYGDKKVKHKKKWKGSDADLKAVAEFIAAQKKKVDVKDPAADKEDEE